jgi:choline dehydrogenase-like flavoprotein
MSYDLVLAGTGFASSFFLLEYLARAPSSARVLVLERGWREPREWQLRHRKPSRIDASTTFRTRGAPEKAWRFTLAFGGGSNCWFGCTPRLLPNDFRLKSLYGVGTDWPLTYEDLEPWYERVEEVMAISGPHDGAPYPRRVPPPQPPHRLSDPDRLLAAAYPAQYFAQPTARARVPVGTRGACCANGVCGLCPVDAKFTIENGLAGIYRDPRVVLQTGARVASVDIRAGRAHGVVVERDGRPALVEGDLIALGTNAVFNAAILLRSGLPHPLLGRRLFEQLSVSATMDLDGVDNFQGSTAFTGHGYMLYDGPHRATHAACLIESSNQPFELRWEPGRERQVLTLKFILEDLPQERNRITLDADDVPVLHFEDYSEYAYRGIQAVASRLEALLSPLPIERLVFDPEPASTESHVLGTVVMGTDPATSIVDRLLVHHRVRNLVVLGGSAFPTSSPANPTLTLSALASWSAHHLLA